MRDIANAILAIVTGIIVLAIVSVILSRKSQTPSVIQSFGSFLGNVVGAAVKPVS